jgi:hypothetical protein
MSHEEISALNERAKESRKSERDRKKVPVPEKEACAAARLPEAEPVKPEHQRDELVGLQTVSWFC